MQWRKKLLPPKERSATAPEVAIYAPTTIGGLRKYTQQLVRHLATSCLIVTTLDSAAYTAHWRAPVLRWPSGRRHRTFFAKLTLLLRHLRNMLVFIHVASQMGVGIAHIQEIEPLSLTLFLPLMKSRFLVVLSVHDVSRHRPYARITAGLERFLLRSVYRRSDALFVFSQYGRERLIDDWGVAPNRVHFTPLGCVDPLPNPEPDRQTKPQSPLFLMFGSYRENKGFEVLVDAFLEAKAAGLPGRLSIAGKYPVEIEKAAVSRYYNAGFASSLQFTNRFIAEEEIDLLLRSADVMVLPYTRYESQSGVLFLAYAYNMPLVASRVGGLEEMLKADTTGILVDPSNPQQLMQALFGVLAHWEELVGREHRKLLETVYSWARIGRLTDEVYSMLALESRS